MAVRQFRNTQDLNKRLSTMRLEAWCFENALARGSMEAASYSSGAPNSAPELGRWLRSTEELHNGLVALQAGWERADPMNQPTWFNPVTHTAIVVSSGDENTGQVSNSEPSNRNPKGQSFAALVEDNSKARLFDAFTAVGDLASIKETWVFLYYAYNGRVFSELSLPILMPNGYIESWHERLLMPTFDDGAGAFENVTSPPDQDFGFTIERR